MKLFFTIIILCTSVTLSAQNGTGLFNKALQLQVGKSKHGTGDLNGFSFNVTYKEYFRPHLYGNVGLGASVHNGQKDGSVKYTTGGMQVFGGIGFSPVRTQESELEIRLNALIRYQSNSTDDIRSIWSPSGYPYPLVEARNTRPARTVSAGAFLQAGYNYSIMPKVYLGVAGSFQTDTEGYVIADYSFTIGRRF